MTNNEISESVQTLYVAIMGRAADYPGLQYWVNNITKGISTLDDTRAAFIEQPEYTAIYGELTTTQLVTKLYQNLFERDPEPEGLAYWVGELDKNGPLTPDNLVATLVQAALEHAMNDAQVINNKVAIANDFTQQSRGKIIDQAFTINARDAVKDVALSTASITTASEKIAQSIPTLSEQFIWAQNFETQTLGQYDQAQLLLDVGPNKVNADAINLKSNAQITTNSTGQGLTVTLAQNEIKAGLQFYTIFEDQPEAYASYTINFDPNFDFTNGTKLPGLGGRALGQPNATANREVAENGGFSFRFMIKEDGEIELYSYLPGKAPGPGVKENLIIDGETLFLARGEDYTITQHVVMNDKGQNNGLLEVYINGQLGLQKTDLMLGNPDDYGINRLYTDLWNGGNDQRFAPTHDSNVTIDNIGVSTSPISVEHFVY